MSKDRTSSFNLNSFTNIFSTPSVVTSPAGIPWYETLNCKDSVDMIHEYGEKAQEAFIGMGYFFKRIKEKELFKEQGYDNMWTFAKEQFNMDESAVSRFVNLCEKFSENGNSPMLDNKYKGYSKSQLIEMLAIKDEQTMEKVTPDMTIKEIREVKKGTSNEPTDEEIRIFFNKNLRHDITADQWADLKNYMSKNYRHQYYGAFDLHFQGSARGICINNRDEITWAKFVSRVYLLEDLVPDSIKNQAKEEKEDVLPGQLDLENDFPQYCPKPVAQKDNVDPIVVEKKNCDAANNTEHKNDKELKFPEKEEVIIDGTFREISANQDEKINLFKKPMREEEYVDWLENMLIMLSKNYLDLVCVSDEKVLKSISLPSSNTTRKAIRLISQNARPTVGKLEDKRIEKFAKDLIENQRLKLLD